MYRRAYIRIAVIRQRDGGAMCARLFIGPSWMAPLSCMGPAYSSYDSWPRASVRRIQLLPSLGTDHDEIAPKLTPQHFAIHLNLNLAADIPPVLAFAEHSWPALKLVAENIQFEGGCRFQEGLPVHCVELVRLDAFGSLGPTDCLNRGLDLLLLAALLVISLSLRRCLRRGCLLFALGRRCRCCRCCGPTAASVVVAVVVAVIGLHRRNLSLHHLLDLALVLVQCSGL
mmetsp:Transcript_36923/g.96696  ORF Transcript_36923/g.96696 Transcript_36923/m.96696 type:complete len:228 (-) Transcript_36923:146-829(-)